jgi:DNA-binding MarR family transcriptional regulator
MLSMSAMKRPRHTEGGAILTELILELFRLNGRILTAGDQLTKDIGLTSARWQVLGAIALAHAPQPVAHIARRMGITRQSVQRIVNELKREGFLELASNPHHQRALLVTLTEKGSTAYAATTSRQIPWANRLASKLTQRNLEAAVEVLRTLSDQLHERAGKTQDRRGKKQ